MCEGLKIVEKNSSSCEKSLSCVRMIFAHFAVPAVGRGGRYTLKIIRGF